MSLVLSACLPVCLSQVSYMEIYNEKVKDLLNAGYNDFDIIDSSFGPASLLSSRNTAAIVPCPVVALLFDAPC